MSTNKDGKQVELLIQDMPESIRNKIAAYEAEKLAMMDVPVSHMLEREEKEIAEQVEAELIQDVELTPWVKKDELAKHEIVELETEEKYEQLAIELKEKRMPMPKYFQELFDEFDELKGFNLERVIYDEWTQELFMKTV